MPKTQNMPLMQSIITKYISYMIDNIIIVQCYIPAYCSDNKNYKAKDVYKLYRS